MFPVSFSAFAAMCFATAAASAAPAFAVRPFPPALAPLVATATDKDEKAAGDANPLTASDPFVGQFSNEEMLIVIRPAVEGYVGEIRRVGRSFSMAATVKADGITGSFKSGQSSFEFTAALDGANLKLTTGNKVFSLTRKEAAGESPAPLPPAAPDPRPKVPAPLPVGPAPLPAPPRLPPEPSKLPPAVTPATATRPEPAKPVFNGPLPQHFGYAQLSTQTLRDLAWTKLPAGAFAVFEESAGSSTVLPRTTRRKLVFAGVADGRVKLRNHDWDGNRFEQVGSPMGLPDGDHFRIGELGLAKGAPSAESLTIQGVALRCERTPYTGESIAKGGAARIAADVWRSSEVDVPPLVIGLPDKKLLVEPDIVRIKMSYEFRGVTHVSDLQLESTNNDVKIGDQTVRYAVVKYTSTADRPDGKIESNAEWWLSSQIPGSILKTIHVDQVGNRVQTRTCTVVDFSIVPRN